MSHLGLVVCIWVLAILPNYGVLVAILLKNGNNILAYLLIRLIKAYSKQGFELKLIVLRNTFLLKNLDQILLFRFQNSRQNRFSRIVIRSYPADFIKTSKKIFFKDLFMQFWVLSDLVAMMASWRPYCRRKTPVAQVLLRILQNV